MPDKEFISANDLQRESFLLAKSIYDSGYRPEAILVLWRGGTPVGIVVHEYFLYKGVNTYHTAVKAESYVGIDERIEPKIENLQAVLGVIPEDARVLVVDDIFDSGCTLKKTVELLGEKTKCVKTATLYYKTVSAQTDIEPDFFLRKTEKWIVFPHELMNLSAEEIGKKKPYIGDLI